MITGWKRPWWLAAAVIVLGCIWLWGASQLTQGATYARIGPGMFVTLVGFGLVGLGLLLAAQIARGERFEAQDAEGADTDAPVNRTAFWMGLLGIAMPMLTMTRLGFVPTATVSFVLIAAAFGERRWWLTSGIGLVLATVSWYGFSRLGVSLGPFAMLRVS
jgi:putative tricarboxylic transport membrane protein